MKWLGRLPLILMIIAAAAYAAWPHLINRMLPADSRPVRVDFASGAITPAEFERLAGELTDGCAEKLPHIENFREAGILSYLGPETCLGCHEEIEIESTATGEKIIVDLMENLLSSAHYRFFTMRHPNVYGFNGELADNFPMGKIDRPCPKPGSFAMTAWAEIAVTSHGDTLKPQPQITRITRITPVTLPRARLSLAPVTRDLSLASPESPSVGGESFRR